MVEKIYSASNKHFSHLTSACGSCSACKKSCPDIDLEVSYWKESSLEPKRVAFYAFPGLVLGFYAYYLALGGSWEFYFDGTWTIQSLTLAPSVFDSGFYFLPEVPKLIAAPLTLIFFSFGSYLTFHILELLLPKLRILEHKDKSSIAHITKTVAAFVAFNFFYLFAGAPSYDEYPKVYAFFHFLVITISAIWFWKEVNREERYFLQERFAHNILKKMKVAFSPAINLKEIYYTYANKEKDHVDKISMYKETMLELITDGILNKEDNSLSDKIREQLGITKAEHTKVMRELERENSILFNTQNNLSTEKLYQYKSYKNYLNRLLETQDKINSDEINVIRKQFDISEDEHSKIYNELINSNVTLHDNIINKLSDISKLTHLRHILIPQNTKETTYLKYIISEDIYSELEVLINQLKLYSIGEHVSLDILREKLFDLVKNGVDDQNIVSWIKLAPMFEEELLSIYYELKDEVDVYEQTELIKSLNYHLTGNDIYMISAILLYINANKEALLHDIHLEYLSFDNNHIINEILSVLHNETTLMSVIEKMAYIHNVPLFGSLHTEDLYQFSKQISTKEFKKDDVIFKEGDSGHNLYIMTCGSARIDVEREGKSFQVATVYQDDYIGEIAIIADTPRTATVSALENVSALELTGDDFKELILNNPQISFNVMKNMTHRLLKQKQ